MKALKVGNVAGDVEVGDLALSLAGDLVGGREAFQKGAGAGRSVALAHNVLVGAEGRELKRQVQQSCPLVFVESDDVIKLADEGGCVRIERGVHDTLLLFAGGSTRISQPSAPKFGG